MQTTPNWDSRELNRASETATSGRRCYKWILNKSANEESQYILSAIFF